jgi:DNA-binding MarR family transcriptional regulator
VEQVDAVRQADAVEQAPEPAVSDQPARGECVCTSLRMATRSVNRLYDRALSPAGLRVTGYSILTRLAEEGPLPVGELAGRLAMERTTCTREVAPLVAAGLVEDAAGPDRRRRLLRLTSLGQRRRAEAYPLWERVQRMVGDAFGEAEVAGLLARLRRLREESDRLTETQREGVIDHGTRRDHE